MSNLMAVALPEIAAAMRTRWATAWVSVGNGTAPVDTGQTDLSGTITVRRPCNTVSAAGAVLTFIAEFPAGVASIPWNEIGVHNLDVGGVMLAREVLASTGAKPAVERWDAEVQVEFIGVAPPEAP